MRVDYGSKDNCLKYIPIYYFVVSQFVSLVKPFRPRLNSNAHSIIKFADGQEILNYKISEMISPKRYTYQNNIKQLLLFCYRYYVNNNTTSQETYSECRSMGSM